MRPPDRERESRRIGLIRQGDRPRLNATLGAMLEQTFPDQPVDDIDVLSLVRQHRGRYLWSAVTGAAEHAAPLVRRRLVPKRAVVRSSGFAHAARQIVAERVERSTHAFTFQSQSLYPIAVDGVPNFVYTDHAHLANLGYPGFDVGGLATRRYLQSELEVYRTAAKIFTRSEHVRDVIVHGYGRPAAQIEVVGVGPNTPTQAATRPRVWHGGVVLFVGVDWERKGGPQLLSAFSALRETHPDAQLHVVGCKPPGDVPTGVSVHGRISTDDVSRLMAESDVFCLPTLAEPFGVAFIEAMHAGLPVVATAIGATPDFVTPGTTGLLVAPHDVPALTTALSTMLDDSTATLQMGINARSVAVERYSWDVVMSAMRHHIRVHLDQDASW